LNTRSVLGAVVLSSLQAAASATARAAGTSRRENAVQFIAGLLVIVRFG
jgi:hypothetical protein